MPSADRGVFAIAVSADRLDDLLMMDLTANGLPLLFSQLGLPADQESMSVFVATHRPLPAGVALCDASFWTPSQREFLIEAISLDASWSESVETLAALLSNP